MAVSTSVTVANWLLTEVMSQIALDPLRGKYVLLPFLNMADISGRSSKVRKIRKKSAISAAVDDTEATAFSNPQTLGVVANISITPSTKVQGIQLTADAIELALPGVARSQVIDAIQGNGAGALPLVRDAMTEIVGRRRDCLAGVCRKSCRHSRGQVLSQVQGHPRIVFAALGDHPCIGGLHVAGRELVALLQANGASIRPLALLALVANLPAGEARLCRPLVDLRHFPIATGSVAAGPQCPIVDVHVHLIGHCQNPERPISPNYSKWP
jgi:hypothetical protein